LLLGCCIISHYQININIPKKEIEYSHDSTHFNKIKDKKQRPDPFQGKKNAARRRHENLVGILRLVAVTLYARHSRAAFAYAFNTLLTRRNTLRSVYDNAGSGAAALCRVSLADKFAGFAFVAGSRRIGRTGVE